MDCIVNVTQNWGIGKDGDLLVSIPTDLPADRFFPDLDRLPNWRCTDTGPLQEDGGHCFRYLTYENDAPLPL